MTLGINANEANLLHRVGIGQYAFELLSYLYAINKRPATKVYLQNKPLDDFPGEEKDWTYEIFGPNKLWTLTGLQIRLILEKAAGNCPDVFFTLTHYAPLYMPTPSVIAVMDLSFERFKQYFKPADYYQLKYWTKISVQNAARVLTISEFSKTDLCELYDVDPKKIVVTHLGYDTKRFNPQIKGQLIAGILDKYKIPGDYLLFLGTVQPKKNLKRLIEAFNRLSNKKLQLVVVGMINEGRGGWLYQDVFDLVKTLKLENRVIFTGYVPDEEVPSLMIGAKAYILPSLYEGFGIPAIEAIAMGVPTVVSRVSSLPEICGPAASYINDPYDVDSIEVALFDVLSLKKVDLEKRMKLGFEWVKRYNWANTARETLEVLYDAVSR